MSPIRSRPNSRGLKVKIKEKYVSGRTTPKTMHFDTKFPAQEASPLNKVTTMLKTEDISPTSPKSKRSRNSRKSVTMSAAEGDNEHVNYKQFDNPFNVLSLKMSSRGSQAVVENLEDENGFLSPPKKDANLQSTYDDLKSKGTRHS